MVIHPSNSNEQQKAGTVLVEMLACQLGITLESKTLEFSAGCKVQIDGFSDKPPIMCEAWAHVGKVKGSQPDKIMSDALKLNYCEQQLGRKFRKILLFSDEDAMQYCQRGKLASIMSQKL